MGENKQFLSWNPIQFQGVRLVGSLLLFSFCALSLVSDLHARERITLPEAVEESSSPSLQPFFTIQPPRGSTLLLGRGYNSVSAMAGGPCVEAGALETLKGDPSSSTGQKVIYSMQEVQDLSQMRDVLEVNVSGSLGLGAYSGDLKAKYLNESTLNSTSLFLVIKVSVENQTEVLKDFKLTPAAYALLQKSREAFLRACGNQFIAARVTGGEFIAVIEVETSSSDEKRSILAKLTAGGLFWSVSPEFASTLDYVLKHHRASVRVFRTGDQGELPDLKAESLVQYALSFPSRVLRQSTQAWPFLITTESYDSVLDKPTEDWISLADQQRVLEQLSQFQSQAKLELNDVDHVLMNPTQYLSVDSFALNRVKEQYQSVLSQVRGAAQSCAFSPLGSCRLPELRWPGHRIPERRSPHPREDSSSEGPIDSGDFYTI